MAEFIDVNIANAIATLTINRPEALNALNPDVLKELDGAIDALNHDTSVRVVILTGVNKAFVAGADIASMKDMTPEEALAFSRLGQSTFDHISAARPTTIAAINGFALGGGCELAMSCDIRIAADKAKLGIPETSLGVFPGFAGTQRLPRLVGLGIAKELLATAQHISAERAYEIGLVNHVVPKEELLPYCYDLAEKIAKNSVNAIAAGKQMMSMGYEMDFAKAEEYEATRFAVTFASHDQKEGMAAFLEKRSPQFD